MNFGHFGLFVDWPSKPRWLESVFAIVNAARLYHLIPDNALERTNQKFIARFGYLEQKAKEQGRLLDEMTLDEMEAIWQESKKLYK